MLSAQSARAELMWEFDRLFRHTSDAVFAVGPDLRIAWWGPRAEELLEIPASAALGRPCFEVVRGQHLGGQARCWPGCWVMQAARTGQCVAPFRLDLADEQGIMRSYTLGVMAGLRWQYLIHVLRPQDAGGQAGPQDGPDGGRRLQDPRGARVAHLSARERQVLLLVVEGATSREIAARLSISYTTARNHVQNVLAKLGVHRKVDAAILAVHAGLEPASPAPETG